MSLTSTASLDPKYEYIVGLFIGFVVSSAGFGRADCRHVLYLGIYVPCIRQIGECEPDFVIAH